MKGVMSNSRGKETYVVIFRRSFAECSNRWGERPEREAIRREENGKMESGGGGVSGNDRHYRHNAQEQLERREKHTFCSLIYTFIMRSEEALLNPRLFFSRPFP